MKINYPIFTHISAQKISSNILLIYFGYFYPLPPDNDTEPICSLTGESNYLTCHLKLYTYQPKNYLQLYYIYLYVLDIFTPPPLPRQ